MDRNIEWGAVRLKVSSVVTILFLMLVFCRPASANELGWKMRQESTGFSDVLVTFTPTAIKFENRRLGYTFIAKAPNWQFTVFNTTNRTFRIVPFEQVRRLGLSVMGLEYDAFGIESAIAHRKERFLGLDVTVLVLPAREAYDFATANKNSMMHKSSAARIVNASNAEYYIVELSYCSPQIGQILSSVYRLPQTNSIPLGFRVNYKREESMCKMRTTTLEKVSVPTETFRIPEHLKLASALNQVTMPAKSIERLPDFRAFEELGDVGKAKH